MSKLFFSYNKTWAEAATGAHTTANVHGNPNRAIITQVEVYSCRKQDFNLKKLYEETAYTLRM